MLVEAIDAHYLAAHGADFDFVTFGWLTTNITDFVHASTLACNESTGKGQDRLVFSSELPTDRLPFVAL